MNDRLGSVLMSLAAVEQQASAASGPAQKRDRLIDELRKLVRELEGAVRDVQHVKARCVETETLAALAGRRAQLLFEFAPPAPPESEGVRSGADAA
jgi:hypothetical protein